MNAEETVLLLTWLNQHDPRVQLTAAGRDIWEYSLKPYTTEETRQAILEHYKANDSVAASPGGIAKRAGNVRTQREAKQNAIEALPPARHPNSWRSRNPEEWDRLLEVGRQQRRDDLTSRGITP